MTRRPVGEKGTLMAILVDKQSCCEQLFPYGLNELWEVEYLVFVGNALFEILHCLSARNLMLILVGVVCIYNMIGQLDAVSVSIVFSFLSLTLTSSIKVSPLASVGADGVFVVHF